MTGLKVGCKAPDFELAASTGTPVRLRDLLGTRTIVLFFYPKDGTLGCTAEACAFRDHYAALAQAGAEVIGISSDSIASHREFVREHRLPMKLLSDPDCRVRALYGVRPTLRIIPGRATFVVDKVGTIRHVFVSQLRFSKHALGAIEAVQRLQAEEGETGSSSARPPPAGAA